MFGGLPGGSPGPNAEGTWISLLIMLILGCTLGAGFLYFANEFSKLTFYGTMQ
jgi:hypothetical protein